MWSKKRLATVSIVAVVVGSLSYSKFLAPRDASVTRATRGAIVAEAFGTGSVESRRSMSVGFELVGRVSETYVDQGDRVAAGQALAAIDDKRLRAEVALAEQQVALAEASLTRLRSDITRARAVLEGASNNLARVEPMLERGAVSVETLDNAVERKHVAQADLERAEAAEVEGRQAVESARRHLTRTETDLERAVVHSPFEGVVTRRVREIGDVAVPGTSVLELASTSEIWAKVWVDESYLADLDVGQPARIALRSDPTEELTGHVVRVGREVDRETRELLVDVKFDTPPDSLVFGQRVDLWIETERREDVVRVPRSHLVRRGSETGVFVHTDGRADWTPVRLGRLGRDFAEVRSGLTGGEPIVDPNLAGRRTLQDGDRIRSGDTIPQVTRP